MIDIQFLSQLIESMEDAVNKLEEAKNSGRKDEVNKLKVFIFDLHQKINESLTGK